MFQFYTLAISACLICATSIAQTYEMDYSTTHTTCAGTFYDSGGASGNYATNQNVIVTFSPATANAKICVDFSFFESYNTGDILYIYNGPTATASEQIGELNGSGSISGYGTVKSTHASGALTFKFVSDDYTWASLESGWEATISCSCDPEEITMIASGEFTTCSGSFFDGGGPTGNYMPNQNTEVTIYPATANAKICVDFSFFESFNTGDILYIYNGPIATASEQIGELNGSGSISGYGTVKSTHTSGALTFKFVSDDYDWASLESGWEATISCSCAPEEITMIASGEFTTCSGSFFDGGGPTGNYMPNQNTEVTIYPATANAKICVDFSFFESFNTGDILYIYNGPIATASEQIGELNGSGSISGYGTVKSTHTSGALTFKFVSDDYDWASLESGWEATISCSCAPEEITMIASGEFTTCSGSFFDGGGPTGNYMPNQNTEVTIYPATANAKICVDFSFFESYNTGDILYIYNGPIATASEQIGELNGSGSISGYGTVKSTHTSGALTFKFVSDDYDWASLESGWEATISCSCAPEEITMIASGEFTTCSGSFFDGGGPTGNYMPNQNTEVTIYPDCSSNKISVEFSSFETYTDNDYLNVYNGNSTASTLLGTFSEDNGPATITSTAADGSLTFKFVSNDYTWASSEAGWSATISCICGNAVGGTANAASTTLCAGQSTTLSLTGYAGCSIQWQSSTNNVNFTNINGQTNTTYTTPNLNSTMYYRAVVNGSGNCTNANSNTVTVTVITIPAQPGNISVTGTICLNGSNLYSVTAVSGATFYTWSLPIGWSGSSTTNSINATAGANGGTISVSAGNICGSSTAQTLSVTVNTIPAQPGNISGETVLCSGDSEPYSILPVSGATTYTWILPTGWTGSSNSSYIITTAGNSGNITVTANNGCGSSAAQPLYVEVNEEPNTPGAISGSLYLCLGSDSTYSVVSNPEADFYTWTLPNGWSGSSTTNSINVVPGGLGGSISVSASNECGPSNLQTMNVIVQTGVPIANAGNDVMLCGGYTGQLQASGGQFYVWSPTDWLNNPFIANPLASPLETTTYSVTVSNACGSAMDNVVITMLPAIGANITVVEPLCFGGNDGQVTVEGFGGFGNLEIEYVGFNPDQLSADDYVVTIVDENECVAEFSFEVGEPTQVIAEPEVTNAECFGECGSVVLNISGGTGAYQTDWTEAELECVYASNGNDVNITDANGCAAEISFNVTQPVVLNTSMDETNANDGFNGSATVDVIGGTPPYFYQWSNGDSDSTAQNLGQGTYTVVVTDLNGCEISDEAIIIDVSVNENTGQEFQVTTFLANNQLHLVTNSEKGFKAELFDMRGELIHSASARTNKMTLDVQQWATGLYLMNIANGSEAKTVKVVLE